MNRIRHGYSRPRGFYWNSTLHAYRREWPIVDQRATAAIASAQEHGLAMVVADGQILLGAALVEETGERYVEAEIHRLEGNLLLAGNGSAEAEACYVKALEVADAQEARSLELRAAGDLARLWAEQDRRAEAQDLLAPVYGWFTEGFDTPDLG